MNSQSLRTLTTGKLHTEVDDVYTAFEFLIGEKGIMTHMIPNALKAIQPFLKKHVTEPRFWDGKYDPTHIEEYPIEPMTQKEREEFFKIFNTLPSIFEK